jgi:hypothetical protein
MFMWLFQRAKNSTGSVVGVTERNHPSWLVCLRKSHIADGFFMESDAQHLKLF